MAYLLDANVFIQAKNLHYGMDFAPGFWDWLILAHSQGRLLSIEKVGEELAAGQDELAAWAGTLAPGFFASAEASTAASLSTVATWVDGQDFRPSAVGTFLQVADFYLVSQALAGGHTVVTHEVFSPGVAKVKIPNVCLGVGVGCITTFEMLRKERVRLTLAPVTASE